MYESKNGLDDELGHHRDALVNISGLAEPHRSEELYRYLLEHRGGPHDSGIRGYVSSRVDFRLVLNVSLTPAREAVGLGS